jgi:hypothetical protein
MVEEVQKLSETEKQRYAKLKYIVSRSRDVFVFSDFLGDYVKSDQLTVINRLRFMEKQQRDCPYYTYPGYGECYVN